MKTTLSHLQSYLLSIPLLIALVLALPFQAVAGDAATGLLVKWKDGPTSATATAGNAQIGATVKRNFLALGWQLVELPPGMSVSDGLRAYRALDAVAAVEPDSPINLHPPPRPSTNSEARLVAASASTPNDPRYGSQWQWPRIGAPGAWNVTTGSSNIVVAIFDSGVDYAHPDLAPNMWRNPGETGLDDQGQDKATNGIDDDNNGYVDDVHGVNVKDDNGDPMDFGKWSPPDTTAANPIFHGTFIAGLIGARSNNGIGVAGLNWSVQIMAIKFFSGDELDPQFRGSFTSGPLAGFDYVLRMKQRGVNIRVINHSYTSARESVAGREAIVAAGEAGILSVYPAGNSSADRDFHFAFPGAYTPPIIVVAASTSSDTLADFSNFGRSTTDLAAPGESVLSTWKGPNYEYGDGTSYSCPIVAGAAALLLSVNPNLTVDELKSALFGSVDQPASMRGKLMTNGRLNVSRALEYLTNVNPPAIVINTSPAGRRTLANAPIQVTFNRAMDRASVESNFRIEPAVSGTFEWSDDSRSMTFRHDAPFDTTTTNYTVWIQGGAQDATGGMLDGDFDRVREGSPADDLHWTFRFPTANDDFVNAQWLTGATGTIQATTQDTTIEVNEPLLGERFYHNSLWYRWTPPEPGGWFTFDLTEGTAFDSFLVAYTGDALEQLFPVAINDNYGTRINSRISFAAIPGTNYSVVVAGKAQTGAFTLRWYPTPPPAIDSFRPASAYPSQTITNNGTNFTGATRVLFNGVPASFALNTNLNFSDLQLIATVPDNATTGPITIQTPHGNVTTSSNFTVLVQPTLTIRPRPALNLVELSWVSTPGFTAQRTDALGPAAQWVSAQFVSTWLTNNNTVRVVTVTNASPNRFFRLRRQ